MTPLLIVDDEPHARAWLRSVVADEGAEVHEASSGAEALQVLESGKGPWVVLVDWMMPELDGTAFCRIARRRFVTRPHYIIMISGRAGRSDIAGGLSAGADDFLLKPVPPDILRSRVRVAARHISGGRHPSRKVLAALEEAIDAGNGELIVRDGDATARILVHDHAIAWAHITNDSDSLLEALSGDGLSRDELHAAVEEARQTRRSFHGVLVNWGLLTAERLRNVLLAWIRRRVFATLRFRDPQALFVPARRVGTNEYSFLLSEVLTDDDRAALDPTRGLGSVLPPPSSGESWSDSFLTAGTPTPTFERLLDEAMRVEGASSAALFNRLTGVCEGFRGETMDPTVVGAKLQTANALLAAGDGLDDFLVSTRGSYHLLRALNNDPDRLLYLIVGRHATTLGAARAALAHIIGEEPGG